MSARLIAELRALDNARLFKRFEEQIERRSVIEKGLEIAHLPAEARERHMRGIYQVTATIREELAVRLGVPMSTDPELIKNPDAGTDCADCAALGLSEPQFICPSGIVCKFGHGGADSVPR